MEYLDITLEQLNNSHSLKRGQTIFQPAREIVNPFIAQLEPITKEWIIKGRTPTSQSLDVNVDEYGIENVTNKYESYERLNIEAVLKDEYQINFQGNDRYEKVIGFIYALDVQNPIAKVYTGYKRSACLNLTIFGSGNITKRHFNDADYETVYKVVPEYLERISQEKEAYTDILQDMVVHRLSQQELNNTLGVLSRRIVSNTYSGLVNNFVNMLRLIQSPDNVKGIENIYYNSNKDYSKFDIYNALTASVSRKSELLYAPDLILKSHKLFETV